MSDGCRKDSLKFLSEKESLQSKIKKKKKCGTDEYAQAIARIAVAQVCESLGFQGFQQSALDILADVGLRYIREIGKTANFYANLANRSQCNVFDVIQSLEDLGSIQGFSGASDINHSLSGSGVVRDIIGYVGEAEQIPFAYLIPDFPIVRERRLHPTYAQVKENPPDDYIPSWLPKFPDPETLVDLNLGNGQNSVVEADNKIQHVEVQHDNVGWSLQNLPQKLICNRSEGLVAPEQGDGTKAQAVAESNPFLNPPLQVVEKEVSLPVLPTKLLDHATAHHNIHDVMGNHVSAFSSANEADKSGPSEPEDRRKILLNGRPSVHFKFGNARKHLGMAPCPRNVVFDKISLWFGDDGNDGKDERKRRAEQILKENLEHPKETTYL